MRRSPFLRYIQPLLGPGRASILPTVWSNCLAGWWLGGMGVAGRFSGLLAGGTCLYLGALFLNDAFDAEFDRRSRPARSFPADAGELQTLWRWGFVWLGAGALLLILLGRNTGTLALYLVVGLVLVGALHRLTALAPALEGICRWLLYLVAASAGARGVTGEAMWCGLALALYVSGVRYLAQQTNRMRPPNYWPCAGLIAPILLGLLINAGAFRQAALLLSLVLGFWTLRSLRPAFWSPERNVGQAVGQLLAGIVFVDWLAVANAPRESGFVFIPLFLLALLLQRFIRTA